MDAIRIIYLGIRITQFDGDIPLQFVLESDRMDTGDGLDDGRFPVCDVSDRTYDRRIGLDE